jgi:flagellar hook-associated protein 3 FlgL
MRIDSSTYQNATLAGIQSNQTSIARLSLQISNGFRMQSAKDDPISATKAMDLSNRISVRTQYAENQTKAELDLDYENLILGAMSTSLSKARSLFLSVSSSQSAAVKDGYAEQLKGVFNEIVDLANTQSTSGDYIFGGTASNVKPFANGSVSNLSGDPATVEATTFDGEAAPGPTVLDVTRQIEIGIGHRLQVSDSIVDIMSFTDDTIVDPALDGGSTHDVLQNLANAIVNLQENTMTEANLQSYVNIMAKANEKVVEIQQRIAGAQSEIDDSRASTQAVLLLEKNALSDLTLVDKAAAIVELQSRQTALEAVSRAYSLTSSLSLFNYLG